MIARSSIEMMTSTKPKPASDSCVLISLPRVTRRVRGGNAIPPRTGPATRVSATQELAARTGFRVERGGTDDANAEVIKAVRGGDRNGVSRSVLQVREVVSDRGAVGVIRNGSRSLGRSVCGDSVLSRLLCLIV